MFDTFKRFLPFKWVPEGTRRHTALRSLRTPLKGADALST